MTNLPKYIQKKLKDGTKLILIGGLPTNSVTISAYLKAGFRFDPSNKPGLAHFTEHMLFNGTKSFPTPREVALAVEKYGGWHRAFTWIEYQSNTIHLPKDYLEVGLKLLSESLLCPLINESEVEREKGVVKEEVLTNRADPSKAVWDYAWFPVFFQGTRLARPYTGLERDITNFSKYDIDKFIIDYFQPKNTIIFIAGNFQDTEAIELAERYSKNYKDRKPEDKNKEINPNFRNRVYIHNDFSYYQTSIAIGFKTVPFDHKLKYVFEIIREMLAGYFSAPLIQKLRDEGGLIYTWNAFQDNLSDNGYLVFNFSLTHENVMPTIKTILKEIDRIFRGKFKKEEVETAKNHLIGKTLANIETGKDYIYWYGLQELLNSKNILGIKEKIGIYKSITMETVRETAKDFLSADKILIGILGRANKKEIESLL